MNVFQNKNEEGIGCFDVLKTKEKANLGDKESENLTKI